MQNVDGRDMWPLTLPPPTHKQMHTHSGVHAHTVGEDSIDLKRILSQ